MATMRKVVVANAKTVSPKVLQSIEQEIKLLDDIATKSKTVLTSAEDELYGRLRETYVLYYKWMSSKNKVDYIDALEGYLDEKNIPHNAGTSEALMMTKAILGEQNKSKASKYGKHMDTAFRKGVTAKEYPAWMQENGVEAVSRLQPRIKHAKKVKIDERSKLDRASALIYKWLEIRQALPLASSVIDSDNITSYGTLRDEQFTNTHYELAICKRTKAKNGKEKIDKLWLLPKTAAIEQIYLHQLAHAIYNDLPQLEAQMAADELKVFGNEVEQLMLEDEIYQFAYQDDALLLEQKLRDAHIDGRDTGEVYASHTFTKPKPKIKKPKKAAAKKAIKVKKPTAPLLPKRAKANAKLK